MGLPSGGDGVGALSWAILPLIGMQLQVMCNYERGACDPRATGLPRRLFGKLPDGSWAEVLDPDEWSSPI
ncbi:hypothetical protein Kpho02_28700 [Kitasatospora phosalacinea]|uniref:Uncharacterized protein n=1 Tax=Kitasatospora phosalacinea TaxID=2065 RepID=A0A9W6Q894_9ACTN|nr:hypothetical protein Kpho02_28700 [Kitasatospora phosalacinea]